MWQVGAMIPASLNTPSPVLKFCKFEVLSGIKYLEWNMARSFIYKLPFLFVDKDAILQGRHFRNACISFDFLVTFTHFLDLTE